MNMHLDKARNLGFIARMQKKASDPKLDERLVSYMEKTNCFVTDEEMYNAWLNGYEICTSEYRRYSKA